MTTVPPGRTSVTASDHACSVPAASMTTSAPRPSPTSAPNSSASARRSSRPPTITGQPPASATHAASISPIGPAPRIATVSPAVMPARSTPRRQQASGSTIAATSGATPRGTSCRFTAAMRSGTTSHSAYAPERNTSSRHCSPRAQPSHTPHGAEFAATTRRPSTSPQNSCPNGAGDSREQQRVSAPVRLQVGAVGERDLDLDEHVARPRLRDVATSSIRRSPGA